MKSGSSLKWLLNKSKGQRGKFIALILANAIFSILTVAFAYLVKIVVDGAVNGDGKTFLTGAIAIVIAIILQFVLRLTINGLAEHIKGKLEIDYKTSLFKSILGSKYSKVTAYHSGELMNRLTADVGVVADGVSTILPTVIASVVRLLCGVVVLCLIDWTFALALIIAGVIVFAIIALLRGKLKSLHKRVQETDGKTRSFMQEIIENILAIKVFSATDKAQNVSNDLQKKNFDVKMKRKNYSVLGMASYNFVFSAGYLFALIYGGAKIFNGAIGFGYGDLSAILQLVNSIQVPFASLSSVMPKYYSTIASAERLMEIENLEKDQTLDRADAKDLYSKMQKVVIDGVTFTYGDREGVYQDASITFSKGQSVAITGLSGVGKSTIMKLMLGVYPLDSGEIYLDLGDQKMVVGEYTRSLFSYVPQGNMLFSGTIRDNVTFIKGGATKQEIDFALKVSCADQFVDELPNKEMTIVGENGMGLSEGQVQRLAIARAVLSGAPIMLLDEATGSLDEKTEKQVIENLLALKDTTVILVSHRISAAGMCDRVVKVENKRFITQD